MEYCKVLIKTSFSQFAQKSQRSFFFLTFDRLWECGLFCCCFCAPTVRPGDALFIGEEQMHHRLFPTRTCLQRHAKPFYIVSVFYILRLVRLPGQHPDTPLCAFCFSVPPQVSCVKKSGLFTGQVESGQPVPTRETWKPSDHTRPIPWDFTNTSWPHPARPARFW